MILDQRPPPAAGPSVQDHQNLADESGNEPRCFACRAVRAAATCPPGRPARPPGGRLQHHGAATRHRAAGPDAGRIVRRVARRAGLAKKIGPHTLRHAFITAALDAGIPLQDVQEAASHADPRTTMRSTRSRPGVPRPARHLHRRRLHRRSSPVAPGRPLRSPPGRAAARQAAGGAPAGRRGSSR